MSVDLLYRISCAYILEFWRCAQKTNLSKEVGLFNIIQLNTIRIKLEGVKLEHTHSELKPIWTKINQLKLVLLQ